MYMYYLIVSQHHPQDNERREGHRLSLSPNPIDTSISIIPSLPILLRICLLILALPAFSFSSYSPLPSRICSSLTDLFPDELDARLADDLASQFQIGAAAEEGLGDEETRDGDGFGCWDSTPT